MNGRNSHETTRGKMIRLGLCLGTTLLMSPLVLLAQSNAVTAKLEGQTNRSYLGCLRPEDLQCRCGAQNL